MNGARSLVPAAPHRSQGEQNLIRPVESRDQHALKSPPSSISGSQQAILGVTPTAAVAVAVAVAVAATAAAAAAARDILGFTI